MSGDEISTWMQPNGEVRSVEKSTNNQLQKQVA